MRKLLDKHGNPTNDSRCLPPDDGCLLPFQGHKGYALALMCGVEFYITVLPFLFWIGEPVLARSMCVFTAGMTYIGNALKDAFCSPRPRSPPVRRTSRHAQGDTGLSATEEYEYPAPVPDAALMAYVHRVSLMKKTHERFAAMFEARDAPTIYNVWRRM